MTGHATPAEESDNSDAKALERIIAVRAREYRQAAGLSVGEMAQRVGISEAMLSKIENARTACGLTTLSRLARGLDVPVTALFRTRRPDRPVGIYMRGGPVRSRAAGRTARPLPDGGGLRGQPAPLRPASLSGPHH